MSCETCFIRKIVLKTGKDSPDHMHMIDHISRVSFGSVFLRAYDSGQLRIEGTFIAPVDIFIKKEWKHKFTAIEDAVIECIFEKQELSAPIL